MSFKHNILNFVFKNRIFICTIYFNIMFGWLPIKKNKIVFCNYLGCGYGCNPKYIAEEIIKQKLPVEIVWITKPEFIAKKEEFPKQIKLVNFYKIYKCLYELATAKVWINNMRMTNYIRRGLKKKNGQFYLNTWHGSLGIKRIDADVEKFNSQLNWKSLAQKDSQNIDIMLSNSDFETDVYCSALWYENEIIKSGHPRNDIFFNEDTKLRNQIKEKIGIDKETKIALYVPSFRDNLRTNCFNLDYECLKHTLEQQTGNEWEIVTKFHPNNLYKLKYITNKSIYQHDVSLYPDIQELLYVSDIIISDYSSCMFDFMLTRRPCFIYAMDIEQYNNERGFYFPLESTPFPIARNNDEMEENIKNFDKKKYIREVEEFLASKNVLEDGSASERTVKIIRKVLNND